MQWLGSVCAVVMMMAAARFGASTRETKTTQHEVERQTKHAIDEAKARVERGLQRRPSGDFFPSPERWSDQIFYLVMPDRFDRAGDPMPPTTGIPPSLAYNGGNLRGITRRLDYLKLLGITTVLVTPIFETLPDRHAGTYHGYCLRDPTRLNPHFGDDTDLVELVRAAHERGIRVVLDIVINHLCHEKLRYGRDVRDASGQRHTATTATTYQCADDHAWDGFHALRGTRHLQVRRDVQGLDALPAGFANPDFFSRCGSASPETMNTRLFGDFSERMFDLNSTNLDLAELLGYVYADWLVRADVDGFRFDAAAHVNELYVASIARVLRETAARMGKSNLFLVGEVADRPHVQRGYLWDLERRDELYEETSKRSPVDADVIVRYKRGVSERGPTPSVWGLDSIYDFEYSGHVRDFFIDRPEMFIHDAFYGQLIPGQRSRHFKFKNQPGMPIHQFLVQVDSHDWPRVFGRTTETRARQALAVLLTGPGIPIITYGTEQGFSGQCDFLPPNTDPLCMRTPESGRQAMFSSAPFRLTSVLPSIDASKGSGSPAQTGIDYFQTDHWLFNEIETLIQIRKKFIAPYLARDWNQEIHLLSQSDPRMIAFFASPNVVTIANKSSEPVEITGCRSEKPKAGFPFQG